MANYPRYCIIAPSADITGITTATGIPITTALYIASDTAPRAQWGAYAGTPYNATQEAAIEDPVTGCRATYPDSAFVKYDARRESGVPAAKLVEFGLTTSAT